MTLEIDHEKTSVQWDKPLQARVWGARSTGGIDYFFNYYEVLELTQEETQIYLSQAISYWRWRTLPKPPDPMSGEFGYVVPQKVHNAILKNGKVSPVDGARSTLSIE